MNSTWPDCVPLWSAAEESGEGCLKQSIILSVLSPYQDCLQYAWLQTGTRRILSRHGTRQPTFSIRFNSRNKTSAPQTWHCGTNPYRERTRARQDVSLVLGATRNLTNSLQSSRHWDTSCTISNRGIQGVCASYTRLQSQEVWAWDMAICCRKGDFVFP